MKFNFVIEESADIDPNEVSELIKTVAIGRTRGEVSARVLCGGP